MVCALTCVLGLAALPSAATAAEPVPAETPAVGLPADAGGVRDALRDAEPAWYDDERDSWRRVDPKPPEESTFSGIEVGTSLFAYVMYAVVAALVGLLVWQLWRMRGSAAAADDDGQVRRAAPISVGDLPFDLPALGDGDLDAALRAACAAGDWSRAVILLYALELVAMDRADVVQISAGKTNRGYEREAASAHPEVRAALSATIAVFERSYFGHQSVAAAEVEELRQGYQRLLAGLPQPEAA